MARLVASNDLPEWISGRLRATSMGLGWSGLTFRSYSYPAQSVQTPGLEDYLLVRYRSAPTRMQRESGKGWQSGISSRQTVSLLTRGNPTQWAWDDPVEVDHFYISPTRLHAIASEMSRRPVAEVELADVLVASDPLLLSTLDAIAHEARSGGFGGALYVDALTLAVCGHLLRHHARITPASAKRPSGLSVRQMQILRDFIEENLGQNVELDQLAALTGLSTFFFARQFRKSFGIPPYAWVIDRRTMRARDLLALTRQPIKQIALDCGFADQAHLTRLFARRFGTTPAAFRRSLCQEEDG